VCPARYPCQSSLSASFGPDSAPDSFTRRCGNSLAFLASDRLWIAQAAPPLSRLALSTHVSWTHRRPVSISSVKTLRHALVCILPLSALPFGVLMDPTEPPNLSLIGAAWSFRFRLPDLRPLGSGAL